MKSEIKEFIEQAGISRASIARAAEMLPEDDTELDNWIGESVRESDPVFMTLALAALSRERPVNARHLAGGAKLIGSAAFLPLIVFRASGEMPEYLLEGLRNTAIYSPILARALFSIAIWCDAHRGGVYPAQLIPEARALARREPNLETIKNVDPFLINLALRTNDTELLALIRKHHPTLTEPAWQKIVESLRGDVLDSIVGSSTPLLDLLPETPQFPLDPSRTVRRATPRLGRNEPCHCGSGKKYKHCHYDKDQERLQHSSGVAGRTLVEVRANPERHLTFERLNKMAGVDLGSMNPFEIPPALRTDYFVRLSLFNLDRAVEFLEKLGFADDLEDSWVFAMFSAVRFDRKDIAERLMKLREPSGFTEDQLRLSQRLLLAQDDPAKCIRLIEEAAHDGLKTDKPEDFSELAFAVAYSKFSALGVLLYRGALPLISPKAAKSAYEQVQLIRERLNLSREDPIHEVLETLNFAKGGEDPEAALREAEEKFEAKRREVRALRESFEQLQKELSRHEKASAPDSPVSDTSPGKGEEQVRELRVKVRKLETDLKERHNERNALQRRLGEMQITVEALHERAQLAAAENSGDTELDHEDDLLLPQDAESNQPVRLIEFPKNFHEHLSEFPHHVSRAAMIMLGRLAGGDSSAFSGTKRLKSRPNVMRQRIGIDFRLLFRLLPDRIQVVDLITRQDLERRIKTLP